jgi:hypothetical protein
VKCSECPRWTGRKYSKWSDCHYVVSTLIPNWSDLRTRFGFPVSTPFDPHDAKYLEESIPKPHSCDTPEGVRIQHVKEKDIWFDDEGHERTKTVRLDFYQTHKDYYCGYEEV